MLPSGRDQDRFIRRERVFSDECAFEVALDSICLEALRRAIAPWFDRAAHAVEAAGYAQDDSLVDRYLICRDCEGHTWTAAIESLSDAERLRSGVIKAAPHATGGQYGASGLRILAF